LFMKRLSAEGKENTILKFTDNYTGRWNIINLIYSIYA